MVIHLHKPTNKTYKDRKGYPAVDIPVKINIDDYKLIRETTLFKTYKKK